MLLSRLLIICMVLTFLSACTFGVPVGSQKINTTKPLAKSKLGNPSSYIVMGKRYYVMDSSDGFKQRGIASWYGPDFHGKKTSSGDIYNMHALTAAHKTLPIPVYVKVTNLENGKTAVVLVNDRGPFVDGRIIDLSHAAAKKLGVIGPGTAEVEIVALNSSGKASLEPVRAIPLKNQQNETDSMFIQLGSFSSEENARKMFTELKNNNEGGLILKKVTTGSGVFFRVQQGPFLDLNEANAIKKRLANKGYSNTRIIIDSIP